MSYFIRTTVARAPMTVSIKQYADSDMVQHIDTKMMCLGTVVSEESRILDWKERELLNAHFGLIIGKCCYISHNDHFKICELNAAATVHDIGLEAGEEGVAGEQLGPLMCSVVRSVERGWTWTQTWGAWSMNGAKKHLRRQHLATKSGEQFACKLIYDWQNDA
jgi:hypothetical protein